MMKYQISHNYMFIAHQITQLSPLTHFQELLSGSSQGSGFDIYDVESGSTSTIMQGIFDMSHTLGYWIKQYWMNLAVLIVSPMILLIMSFL